MRLSPQGRAFIEGYEARIPTAYKDSAGKWTIGIGHLITDEEHRTGDIVIDGLAIPWPTAGLTDVRMDALFAQDLAPREHALDDLLTSAPTQQQYDAMLSLLFNIGEANFATSTVRRKFNAGDYEHAADAILLFHNKRNPVTHALEYSEGLMKRRVAEREMFTKGIYDATH